MLLRVGLIMMVLSLALAAGVAFAVVGFQGEAPETTTVSSTQPQPTDTTAQRKPDRGDKLEIDEGNQEVDQSKQAGDQSKQAGDQSKQVGDQSKREESKAPPPLPVADWPRATDEEVAGASGPRYYEPLPGTEMSLTVEALGLYDVPVVSSNDLQALDAGLMHVPETSFPWDEAAQRNVYIAGHYLGYPDTNSRLVFYNLDQLNNGDEVIVEDSLGRAYTYRVSESFSAGPDESWVMGQEVGRDMLTLQTCIPPGFEERLIVRADRV